MATRPGAARSDAPGLHWALKRSFLTYVAHQPDGRCSVTDGADLDGEGRFFFAWDAEAGGELRSCGDLRFAAHHGMLFVRIAAPRLALAGATGVVRAQVDPQDGAPHVPLATFARAPGEGHGTQPWRGSDLQLTAEGAEVFGGVYEPGEPLEDFVWVPPAPSTHREGP